MNAPFSNRETNTGNAITLAKTKKYGVQLEVYSRQEKVQSFANELPNNCQIK
ncbi:MAG: hypothetical protein HRT70_08520 [Flavobacteriaceae bacterium]|nr:hypothetical protein [Flavobacteriaceae bacterium]NQZ63077.1 hypothetical protein [Crocosphaera sp.]